jgi:tetratricopeptide (TPR) repeat protein
MAKIPEASSRGHELHCDFDGCSVQLRSEDLSQAGVFVGTTEPLALDREVTLTLRSSLGAIEVHGQVVQVISRSRATAEKRSPGFGVLFFDLSDDQRAFIGLTLDAHGRAERQRSAAAAEHDRQSARRDQTLLRLERELHALKDKSLHAVLGLAPGATKDAIRKAYLDLSKRYHPHVYAHFDSPDISRLATELFIAHKRAYAQLQSQRVSSPLPAEAEPAHRHTSAEPAPPPIAPAPPPHASRAPGPVSHRPSRRAPRTPSGIGLKTSMAPLGPARMHSMAPPRETPRAPATGPQSERRPKHPEAELALQSGLKHLGAKRYEKAAMQIELALQLCPELREAAIWQRVCRARERAADGDKDAAHAEYRALLEIEPQHPEALEHAGDSGRRAKTGRNAK